MLDAAFKIEVKNLTNYTKPQWIREIFEIVINCIKPEFDEGCLVITDNIAEYIKKIQTPKKIEIGITGLLKKTFGIEFEAPWWKGGMTENILYIFVNPFKIISDQLMFEQVTAGFAHEISEMVVIKSYPTLWSNFFPEQINLLELHPEINLEKTLEHIIITIRDRLADKLSAEKGFAREILAYLTDNFLKGIDKGISSRIKIKMPFPVISLIFVSLDKSLSLEDAGFSDLAKACLNRWEEKLSDGNMDFFNYYKDFRKKLLSLGLTSNSLLSLLNMEL